jgi:hypothetical protein
MPDWHSVCGAFQLRRKKSYIYVKNFHLYLFHRFQRVMSQYIMEFYSVSPLKQHSDSQPNTHPHWNCMLSGETVFGLTQPGLEPWSTVRRSNYLTHWASPALLNVSWYNICTSLHVEGNVLNGSLNFTKYNKRIIWKFDMPEPHRCLNQLVSLPV